MRRHIFREQHVRKNPELAQWLHSCAGCGFKGHKTDAPEMAVGKGKRACSITDLYPLLELNGAGMCSQCNPPRSDKRIMRKWIQENYSETECNNTVIENIVVGKEELELRDRGITLSEIMHTIENLEIPDAVKERWPDLTVAEWDAATRAITLLLLDTDQYGKFK